MSHPTAVPVSESSPPKPVPEDASPNKATAPQNNVATGCHHPGLFTDEQAKALVRAQIEGDRIV